MYITPDVLMPVASALAAVTGAVLLFWRRVVALFCFLMRRAFRKKHHRTRPRGNSDAL
jgi:hypothetical protein